MSTFKVTHCLQHIYKAKTLRKEALMYLLSCQAHDELAAIFGFADNVRHQYMGEGVLLRGLIEFSNFCENNCFYCGLRRDNDSVARYRLTDSQIMDCVDSLFAHNIKTVVLQSGEDGQLDAQWLASLIDTIKSRYPIAITLSVGERTYKDYQLWRNSGADRYLLKIETTDPVLYASLHAGRELETRIQCLEYLRELKYQVGSGSMIGLPGQTLEMIAGDIIFFKKERFDMIGIGPFIPHPQTPLREERKGDVASVLKALALTRIIARNAHLPATTALGSLDKEADYRMQGLKAGANVLMPNFTPVRYKALYEIYPGKRCISEKNGACVGCLEKKIQSVGRSIDYSIGNSLK